MGLTVNDKQNVPKFPTHNEPFCVFTLKAN